MEKRQLDFRSFDQVCAEMDRLHTGGYQKAGNWDLAQVCDHLTLWQNWSIDGSPLRAPWFLRMIAPMILNRVLKTRRLPGGRGLKGAPLPKSGGDESAAIAQFRKGVDRFKAFQGQLAPSPLFGNLDRETWTRMHLIHAAHHLGFLVPTAK